MAGTITGVLNRIQTQQGRPKIAEVVLTCTAIKVGGETVNGL